RFRDRRCSALSVVKAEQRRSRRRSREVEGRSSALGGLPAPALDVLLRHLDRTPRRLGEADVVAERVAQRGVDAVGLPGRQLGELDAERGEALVLGLAVVGVEDAGGAEGAPGEQVTDLCGRVLAQRGRRGYLQEQ